MTKYIECEAAIALASGGCHPANVAAEIAKLPPANVMPVVLCRNCKSYNKPRLGFCEAHLVRMHGDDFCSYGKKREVDDG